MKKPKIIELDFSMGNIRSLQKAFEYLNQPVTVSDNAVDIKKADALLLPGDGAFGEAIKEIKKRKFFDPILEFHEKKKPILGICIGFQILFESSEEFGNHNGFSFIKGNLKKFKADPLTVPHIGWSKTKILRNARLTKGISNEEYFYYIHSYRIPDILDCTIGSCEYGTEFTSIIEKENLFGTQFHPEKSQKWGLKLLENFIDIVKNI